MLVKDLKRQAISTSLWVLWVWSLTASVETSRKPISLSEIPSWLLCWGTHSVEIQRHLLLPLFRVCLSPSRKHYRPWSLLKEQRWFDCLLISTNNLCQSTLISWKQKFGNWNNSFIEWDTNCRKPRVQAVPLQQSRTHTPSLSTRVTIVEYHKWMRKSTPC